MHVLGLILSFIFGRMNKPSKTLKESAAEIFEEITVKSRKVVILTLVGIGALTIFCGGFFISILDSTTQYDSTGYVAMTSKLGAGLTLILLSSLGFALLFMTAWPGARRHRILAKEQGHAQQKPEPSTLEQALTVLVMDFVHERQSKRPPKTSDPMAASNAGKWNDKWNDKTSTPPVH